MPDTVIVLGSVTPPGRLLSAMRWFAGDLAAQGFSAAKLINLADHRIAFAMGARRRNSAMTPPLS